MSTIRLLIHGEVRDVEGLAALAKRVHAFVEAYEPETLVWECFADPRTGRVAWHEAYASADAYLFHLRNLEEQGFFDEWVRLTRSMRVLSLEEIDDGRVWERLNALNADFLTGVARLVR